jgi:thioredoxin-related protein
MKEVLDIERLCEEHGTTIMKIPAWLPKKGYGRIQSYLKTGK